jgi:hypothetical protein
VSEPTATPSPSPSIAPTPSPTIAPSPTPTLAPTPSPRPDAEFIATALAFARDAGLEVATDPRATIDEEDAIFASADLRRVTLQQQSPESSDLPIRVYLDDDGAVRALEDAMYTLPMGERVSKERALRLARRYLSKVGIDPEGGTLRVVESRPEVGWYITLERELDGYPVANLPMAWWIDGDKVYVSMRPDGKLTGLYAVPVEERRPLPTLLDQPTLERRLANFADRTPSDIRDLDPGFYWVQPRYRAPEDMAPVLALGYCATDRQPGSWVAWCVDAGTGKAIARGEGAD